MKIEYFIPIFLVFLFFPKIFLHPLTYTFNFADNWWYLEQVANLRNYVLFNWTSKIWSIAAPLPTYLIAFVGYFVSDVFLLNIYYFLHLIASWFGAFLLFLHVSRNKNISIFWATFFAFSSLSIYANWFNLMWISFLPFIVYWYLSDKYKSKTIFILYLLLFISWHYFILTWTLIFFTLLVTRFLNKKIIFSYKKIILPYLSAIFLALVIYSIPIFFFSTPNDLKDQANLNRIPINALDLKELIIPNPQNFILSTYWKFIDWYYDSYFRYSLYFWIWSLLIILYSLVYYVKNRNRKPEDNFFFYLLIISLLMFAWGWLVVFWINLIPSLPFKLSELVWLSWIFRKSAYFFYLIAFSLWWLLVLALKNKKINWLILTWLLLMLYFENNVNFYRPVFVAYNELTYKFDKSLKVLNLPNTGYSWWKFNYYSSLAWLDYIKYPDESVPYSEIKFSYLKDDCFINNLIFSLKKTNCKLNINTFKNLNIWYINIYKRHYVTWFFYDSWANTTEESKILISMLEKYSVNFQKVSETEDYIVYKVLH